ncbi:hypothetical protein Efla_007013 [Eimeria flavescens]
MELADVTSVALLGLLALAASGECAMLSRQPEEADHAFASLLERQESVLGLPDASVPLRSRGRHSSRRFSGLIVALAAAAAALGVLFLVMQCTRTLDASRIGGLNFHRALAAGGVGGECRSAGPRTLDDEDAGHQLALQQLQRLSLSAEDQAGLSPGERQNVQLAAQEVREIQALVERLEEDVNSLEERVVQNEEWLQFNAQPATSLSRLAPEVSAAIIRGEQDKKDLLDLMVQLGDANQELATVSYSPNQAVTALFLQAKRQAEGRPVTRAAAAALAAADAVSAGVPSSKGRGALLSSLDTKSRQALPSLLHDLQGEAEKLFKQLYLDFAERKLEALAPDVQQARTLLAEVNAILEAFRRTSLTMPSANFERTMQRLLRKASSVHAFLLNIEEERKLVELAGAGGRGAESLPVGSSPSASEVTSRSVSAAAGPAVAATKQVERQQQMLELVFEGDASGLTAADFDKVQKAKQRVAFLLRESEEKGALLRLLRRCLRRETSELSLLMSDLHPEVPIPKLYVQLQGDLQYIRRWTDEVQEQSFAVNRELKNISYRASQRAFAVLLLAQRRLSGSPGTISADGSRALAAAAIVLGEASGDTMPRPTVAEAAEISRLLGELLGALRSTNASFKPGGPRPRDRQVKDAEFLLKEAKEVVVASELLLGEQAVITLQLKAAVTQLSKAVRAWEDLFLLHELTEAAPLSRLLQPSVKEQPDPRQMEAVFVKRANVVAAAQKRDLVSSALSELEKEHFRKALQLNLEHLEALQKQLVPAWRKRTTRVVDRVIAAVRAVQEIRAVVPVASPLSPQSPRSPPASRRFPSSPPSRSGSLRRSRRKQQEQQEQEEQREPQAEQQEQPQSPLPVDKLVRALDTLGAALDALQEESKIFEDLQMLKPLGPAMESSMLSLADAAILGRMQQEQAAHALVEQLRTELHLMLQAHLHLPVNLELVEILNTSLRELQLTNQNLLSLNRHSEKHSAMIAAARRAENVVAALQAAGVPERRVQRRRAQWSEEIPGRETMLLEFKEQSARLPAVVLFVGLTVL